MRWFPQTIRNQTRWQQERWWHEMPLTFFFLKERLPPFEQEVPQQGMLLVDCQGSTGYLDTTIVFTGPVEQWEKRRWWLGWEIPCCEKHRQRKDLALRVSRGELEVKNAPELVPLPPLSSVVVHIRPKCAACTQLLKAKLAEQPLVLGQQQDSALLTGNQ